MSFHHVDLSSAMRRLAEWRIEDAMAEGIFDHLQGAGQDIELESAPADENARITWWVLRILHQNDFTPDEIRRRKRIDRLKALLHRPPDKRHFRSLVKSINELVLKLNTLVTNALKCDVAPLDEQAELHRLRERRGQS